MSDIGIVAIGRNEGERLRRCLNSVIGRGLRVVYVDSNSTDDSVQSGAFPGRGSRRAGSVGAIYGGSGP